MAVSGQTLTKIQSLARLYQTGYHSNTVDITIAKLVDIERARLQAEAESLVQHMRSFEERFGMPSADFYRRFHAGELGDDADMFEWSAFYQMWLSVQARIQALHA